MAKIADMVKLKAGYANFVHLQENFEATQKNAELLAMMIKTGAQEKGAIDNGRQ